MRTGHKLLAELPVRPAQPMELESILAPAISVKGPPVAVADVSPWLRSLPYDLCFFAFPWLPFLLVVVFGLEWQGGFDLIRNGDNLDLIVPFLFALNFAHRNYTYVVTYGDPAVFRSRKAFFILFPPVVFASMFVLYSFRNPRIDQVVLTALALWNLWHVIMQRYGFLRGYARRVQHGLEDRRHAHLDLALLWCMVLFTVALGALLHLSLAQEYPEAESTVNVLAPVFAKHPIPVALTFGLLLAALGGWWAYKEWQHRVPFKLRLPRFLLLISIVSLLALCVVNPVLGILAFGFSHSVEYFAYVHAVQKRKVEKRQYQGALGGIFWDHMLLGAGILIGSQVLLYYYDFGGVLQIDVIVKTLVSGTAAIHFFYDGLIWKKSKPANSWVL